MSDIFSSKFDIVISILIILLLALMLYHHRKSNSATNKNSVDLGIQGLITKVKDELVKTEQERINASQAPLFELKDFDLEINFVVKESGKGSGSFDFKVVTLGGETDVGSEKTQKIRLHMTAVQPQVRQVKASAEPLKVDESTVISEPPPKEKK